MALTTIFEEQSVAFYDSGEGLYGLQTSPAPFVMIEGDTYTVMWDGTEYVCTCVNFNPQGVEFQAIGNRALAGGESSEEPFLFLTYAIEGADPPSGCILTTTDTSASHTIAVYQGTADEGGEDDGTEEEQEGIVLINRDGEKVPYYGIETVTFDTTTEGKRQTYSKGVKAEKSVALFLVDGNQIVEPDEGTVISKVTIEKPETLLPENIRRGVEVAGVTGEMIGDTEELTVELALADGDQVVVPSADGKVISKATIKKPETLVPENIAKDVEVAGVVGTMEAGSNLGTGAYHIQVFDYDGTVLAEKYLDSGEVFTLPNPPSHERLVFDGWSASTDITDNTVTVTDNDIMVGAIYHTASGATEIDIVASSITFRSGALVGMTSIDWGDGTTDSTITHTYAERGKYTIKIYGMTAVGDGSYNLGGIASNGKTGSSINNTITRVFFSNGVTKIGAYCFSYCYSLSGVVIPNSVTTLGSDSFGYCNALQTVVIPNSLTTLGSSVFRYCGALKRVVLQNVTPYGAFDHCYSLSEVVIPNSVTTLGSNACYYCYGLKKIGFHSGITTIAANCFLQCFSLKKVVFPSGITSIGGSAFGYCCSVEEYDFSACTSVPTYGSNALQYINANCKILVPAALYDTWIAATGWSSFANYIVPV